MKLAEIKDEIGKKYDMEKELGVVFSGIDARGKLLFTQGIIFTDRKLEKNLSSLYDDFVLSNRRLKTLVVDIVKSVHEIETADELKNIDLLKEGVFVGDLKDNRGSFILPNVKGVKNLAQVVKIIKEKVNFSTKQVNVYSFKTQRYVFK